MRLALAPIALHASRERILAYYEEVAALPFAVVYLGEVVCSKRATLRMKDWLALAERLVRSGKEVVIAGKPAIESHGELRLLGKLAAQGLALEVNDLGLLSQLPAGTPFVAGAHLNLYNAAALRTVQERGARRWVASAEIDRDTLAALIEALAATALESEVQVFGRLQLAYSPQCFTAKTYLRTKRNCERCCLRHQDGQRATTLDDRALMIVNGPQTLSAQVLNLAPQVAEMKAMGVGLLRIDPPRLEDTAAIAGIFHALLEGAVDGGGAALALDRAVPQRFCNGYWYGRAGAEAFFNAAAASGGM